MHEQHRLDLMQINTDVLESVIDTAEETLKIRS